MYLNDNFEPQPSPDPLSGLYIRRWGGDVVKVSIPEDSIAFQVGEAMQIQSGGVLRATPHTVRAPKMNPNCSISRNTFAVFIQPDVCAQIEPPPGVRLTDLNISSWNPGQTFGKFAEIAFSKYYDLDED